MAYFDEVLNYSPSESEDYYKLLGCHESASTEQIISEFKNRALKYHPDKNPGDEEAACRFKELLTAKECLIDPIQRKKYDNWRRSGLAISYKLWLSRQGQHSNFHWAVGKKSDLMIDGRESSSENKRENTDDTSYGIFVTKSEDSLEERIRKFRAYEI